MLMLLNISYLSNFNILTEEWKASKCEDDIMKWWRAKKETNEEKKQVYKKNKTYSWMGERFNTQ